jgi:demethoxyubiquinone hydroxylase (CLK1/Coq7/Cat5 family)
MEDRKEEEEVLGSTLTMEKVAAAKQFIENHYRAQMKNIKERKERYFFYLFIFNFYMEVAIGYALCI